MMFFGPYPWVQLLWDFRGFLDFLEVYFYLPDWGSSPSLYFQISFQFPTLRLLPWHPYDSDVGTFKDVLEVPKPLLIFFEFLFLHSVLVECLFLPSAPNHGFESWFPSFTVGFLYISLHFTLHSLHFFLHFVTILNHFCEHPDHQYFELCI